MKYNEAHRGKSFENYLSYLKKIESRLPKVVYDFVSDVNRHNFSKQSLHDSWLKKVDIDTDIENRNADIYLVFLGAYHDREFHFSFENVREYNIAQGLQDMSRDLIAFEIGLENNCYDEEQLVFRAEFSGEGHEIEIYFNDIKVEEKILSSV